MIVWMPWMQHWETPTSAGTMAAYWESWPSNYVSKSRPSLATLHQEMRGSKLFAGRGAERYIMTVDVRAWKLERTP